MNFQVTRIRLSSVGPEPARYDPLELDFRKVDGSGPADTVLFLPNTGGKTVLMRLIFSVLHPPIVERIGTEETARRKKNLLGYVLERDTSHVVVEWRRVENGRFVDNEVLVSGLVAEWRGGRPTGKAEDLVRLWYTVRGPADLVGVDQLTFEVEAQVDEGVVRRRVSLRRFREQLEELRKARKRPRLEVTTTSTQREWIEHLDRLGLDRALFRYQGEMNHNEAGASAIARFKQDRDFIKFFLDAVFDPAELAALDREFDEVADKVRRFPEYERRLQFERAALGELEPLARLVAELKEARAGAESARDSALNLLAAFTGAEANVRQREEEEKQRAREQDSEMRRLTVEADRHRDEWRGFRRHGAKLWVEEAQAGHEAAERRTRILELDARSWTLTEDLARHSAAAANLKALDEAYREELERLRPLQQDRDKAATDLARRLAASAVLASGQAADARARSEAAKKRASAARVEERDALVEAAKLDAAREAGEKRLSEVAALRERLTGEGYLAAGEAAEEARDREASLARESLLRIDAIADDCAALEIEREGIDEADRVASVRRGEVSDQHARLCGEIERAQKERAELSSDPVVLELAEEDEFDIELVGSGIAERLLGRARESDSERLTIELQGVDDKRAIRSLEDTGFLPPPAEVEAALERLAAAGLTGALPGTRYVAEAVARGQREVVAACRADLVGGIVLTDSGDVERARHILTSAALDPALIIAVGPASELVAAEARSLPASTFVIAPAEAVWDRTAAGEERTRRTARVASLDEQRSLLEDRAACARNLADAIARHVSAYPAGWLAMRLAERDGVATEIARLDQERSKRNERRREIAQLLKGLRAESGELQKVVRQAEQRATELQRLHEEEASVEGLAAQVDRDRAEASNWRTLAEQAARTAELASQEADLESTAERDHRSACERSQHELSGIKLSDPIPEPTPEAALEISRAEVDLFDLRARFHELDKRLAGETSASDVAARRSAAITARDELSAAIATHPKDVRERAAALLSTPEAGTLAGRRAGAERAAQSASDARGEQQEAYLVQERAKKELADIQEEIRSSRRPARIPEDRLPKDRHQAAVLAAAARQSADQTQSGVAAAERARNAAREAADRAKKLADNLGLHAGHLRFGLKLAEDADLPEVPPFAGSADDVNAKGIETGQRLSEAVDAEREAESAWRKRDTAVREVLAREEFSDLATTDRLYRRLARSTAEVLARDVDDLVNELRACIGILESELQTLEEDRRLATTSLAKSVQKALSYLRLAERRSKLPDRLRDWSGESFLEVRFDKPPAEELDVRLRTFVVEALDPSSGRPTGTMLLMLALERAVGEFRVKILKPNEAFAPIKVPVSELSSPTFSNGQRATVATALMLMMSELRRQSRSANRGASVGTLLLDNPLGNANAGFLIDVQRTVAAAAGIQLVYTTGIADFSALRRFSNVIALSNDSARRTMRRYVRANPELFKLLVPQDDNGGGRLSAQSVVAISENDVQGT